MNGIPGYSGNIPDMLEICEDVYYDNADKAE